MTEVRVETRVPARLEDRAAPAALAAEWTAATAAWVAQAEAAVTRAPVAAEPAGSRSAYTQRLAALRP